MDLFKKKQKMDIKTLAATPLLHYGKIMLLALGAFAVGKMTGKSLNGNLDDS